MKKIGLIVLLVILAGCSPFTTQYRQLQQAYQSGQLTYPEYVQAYQNLQSQELQWRHNFAQAMQQASYNMQQQQYQQEQLNLQRQQLYMQQTQQYQHRNTRSSTDCHWIGNQLHCDTNEY